MCKCLAASFLLWIGLGWVDLAQAGQKEPTIQGKALSEWLKGLEDKDEKVRRKTLLSLYQVGSEAKPAAAAVVKALKDTDVTIRIYAVLILGKIGPAAKEALPALTDALKDANLGVRAQAVNALVPFGAEAVPALVLVVKDAKHGSRLGAITALALLGPKAEKAIPALSDLLEEPVPAGLGGIGGLRWRAADALEKIGPAAVPALLKAAQKHGDVVFPVLGRLRLKEAVPLLTKALGNAPEYTRALAAQALAALGPCPSSVPRTNDGKTPQARRLAPAGLMFFGFSKLPYTFPPLDLPQKSGKIKP